MRVYGLVMAGGREVDPIPSYPIPGLVMARGREVDPIPSHPTPSQGWSWLVGERWGQDLSADGSSREGARAWAAWSRERAPASSGGETEAAASAAAVVSTASCRGDG